MGINVNGLGTNPYAYLASAINKSSSQTNKTEAYSATFEGKISQTEKVELTEEEKLEAFKKEIWKEIDSWPRNSNVSVSIRITDGAFKRMMTDEEFKNRVMGLMKEDAMVARPPMVMGMTNVDENGYSGVGYCDYNLGKDAFEAHSKGKDSFYVKKASKRQEEKKRLEEEMLKKAQEKRAAMEDYFEHRFASQQRIQSFFKEGLNVDARIAGVQSSALGAMATAAYEQNSILMPIESI